MTCTTCDANHRVSTITGEPLPEGLTHEPKLSECQPCPCRSGSPSASSAPTTRSPPLAEGRYASGQGWIVEDALSNGERLTVEIDGMQYDDRVERFIHGGVLHPDDPFKSVEKVRAFAAALVAAADAMESHR